MLKTRIRNGDRMIMKILNIDFEFNGIKDAIHPVVLKDSKYMILIDCGYSGFMPVIEKEIEAEGLHCSDLTHIIITHHDHDHMGSLADFKRKYKNIKVVASKTEAPYITGAKKSMRLEQAEKMQEFLPEEQKGFGKAFCEVLRNVKPAKVDIEVEDKDVFDWCGGITILGTPGHTPGHISIYLQASDSIVAGDAAALENGSLVIANPQFTLDVEKAEESLNKIISFGASEIICYHGGKLKLS